MGRLPQLLSPCSKWHLIPLIGHPYCRLWLAHDPLRQGPHMSSTRSGHRSPRRSNAVLQAAVISGACAIVSALIGGLFTLLSGATPRTSNSPPPAPHAKPPRRQKTSPTGGGSASQSAKPLKSGTISISVNAHVPLNSTTLCSWHFYRNPMPLASAGQPGITQPLVHIDARCVYPEDPNPQTGVYETAAQIPSKLRTQIPNGTEVILICYTNGQTISDTAGNVSSIWLGIGLSSGTVGYIPDVNIGGGYSRQQLRGLGLSRCGR